jgi:hypothetical protein
MASVQFTTATGGDNSTVDDTAGPNGLANGGFRYRLVGAFTNIVNTAQMAVTKAAAASSSASAAAVSAASAAMAPATNASSTTSLTIGTGSKSLTVETGKNFVIGMNLIIASTATPANYMYGQVTSYTSGSGAMVFNVTQIAGSGTLAAWTLSLSGPSIPTVINELKGTDIASAATINLDTVSGNFVHVTGATTITAITLASGASRTVVFDGALTLTHNATTLILPGAQNILTAAGDSMIVRGDGAGNARVVSYTRVATPIDAVNGIKAAAIAAAATLNLDAVVGNFVHITGSTTITAITIAAGVEKEVYVDATPLLTNSANLVLPIAGDIQCAVGDVFTARGDGSSKAIVTKYTRADGRPLFKSGVELLANAVVSSAVANIDFLNIFTAAYDKYVIELIGLQSSAADTLMKRFANAGTLDTVANYYGLAVDGPLPAATSAFSLASISTTAGNGVTATLEVRNVNAAAGTKSCGIRGFGSVNNVIREGRYTGGAMSGFRLYNTSGANFTAGTIRVYGHRNSN